MKVNGDTIYAEDGMRLRRREDGLVFGERLTLGMTYCVGGVTLNIPRKEIPSDFDEIFTTSFQNNTVTLCNGGYPDIVEQLIRLKYTVSQELAILRQRDRSMDNFKIYDEYCEECKTFAKTLVNI